MLWRVRLSDHFIYLISPRLPSYPPLLSYLYPTKSKMIFAILTLFKKDLGYKVKQIRVIYNIPLPICNLQSVAILSLLRLYRVEIVNKESIGNLKSNECLSVCILFFDNHLGYYDTVQ